ncbi:MAG: hypothetical protein H7840_05645 [Alphaproteobacteria bacterium]
MGYVLSFICLFGVLILAACAGYTPVFDRGTNLVVEGEMATLSVSPLPRSLDEELKRLPRTVTTLVLDSEGGGPLPLAAATVIHRRDMTTIVRRRCRGGCALLFQAGTTRLLGRDAVLVYRLDRHGDINAYGLPDMDRNEAGDLIASMYYAYGLHPEIIRRAQSGPIELRGQQAVDLGAATRWGGLE